MAKKEGAAALPPEEDEAREGEAEQAPPKKPSGLVGRILGPVIMIAGYANPLKLLRLPRKLQLIAGAGLLVVLGGGGAAYYFLVPAPKTADETALASVQTQAPNLPPAQAVFFDIPDIIVNIQTPDAAPSYLKLSVSLELQGSQVATISNRCRPDQISFATGASRHSPAGVMRLKEGFCAA
jgi:hypothetical protein